MPVAPAHALSLGQNRWYEHSGAAAAHPQASLFSFFACEALRTLLIALLDIPVPLALECSCVARGTYDAPESRGLMTGVYEITLDRPAASEQPAAVAQAPEPAN